MATSTKEQSSPKSFCQVKWSLEEELAKNKQLRREDVEALRKFCSTLPDVDISVVPDNLIVALLHSSEYDMEKAHHTSTKYFEIRFSLPEIFTERELTADVLKTALKVGCYCPLPKKTADGYRIVLQSLRQKDPSVYDHVALSKIQTLTLDACIYDDPTCLGYIFVGDMEGISMSHMWKSNFSVTKKLMRYSQEGSALKIHQMHMLNTSSFTYYVMRWLKPFISKHLYDMFQFYTADQLEDFRKVISKEYLPKDYGGDLPEIDDLCDEQTEWLKSMQPVVELLPVKSKKKK